MRSIDLQVTLFRTEADRERSERAMHFVLHALCCIDYEYLQSFRVPPIYRSGVRYDNPRAGKKEWFDVGKCMEEKLGDCKDLACWLVAEHWMKGIRSRPYIRYRTKHYVDASGRRKRFSLYHVLVQLPNGKLEDPSRVLGMGQNEWEPMESRQIAAGWR